MPSPRIRGQFLRFAVMGALGVLVQYAILILQVDGLQWPVVLASVVAYAVGAIANYMLNYYFTFRSARRHHEAMPRFFAVVLIGLAMNTLIVFYTVETLHLYYLLGQMLATVMVLFWNFWASRRWAFDADTKGF